MNRSRRISRAGSLLAVAGSALIAPTAMGQCSYEVTTIQGPPDPLFGPPDTYGSGLNELGQLVGNYSYLGEDVTPFTWTPERGLTTLDLPQGWVWALADDINDSLQIVGLADVPGDGFGNFAFLLEGGTLVNLGVPPGGTFSWATAVNARGQIVGAWGNNVIGPPYRAFVWQDDVMADIDPLVKAYSSQARDINDAGAVTGRRRDTYGDPYLAYVWHGGVLTDLGPIPGGFNSEGYGISSLGHVAGYGQSIDQESGEVVGSGFLWDGREIRDLGRLPGFRFAGAVGINDSDVVVGWSWYNYDIPGLQHGVIWRDGMILDLNDLVPPEGPVWWIEGASDINESGQICGWARAQHRRVAVLLTPVEGRLGDLDCDGHVGIVDFLSVLEHWGPCAGCSADLNDDRIVDGLDVAMLFSNWG